MTWRELLPIASGVEFNCKSRGGGILKALAPAVVLSLSAIGAHADGVSPLRLCADPDNLPFSSETAANPGLYQEIGAAIAQELQRPVTTVWYRTNFGQRAVRLTLLAKQCDIDIGLPADPEFMGPRLIFSKPFMQAGYAFVTKKPGIAPGLDEMNGKAIAVQFSTTPQTLLANYNGIRMVTRMSPEDGVKALSNGDADAALVWGPTAGYLNKIVYSDAFNVTPVEGPGLQWPVAAAFAARNTDLRDQVNAVIDRIGDKIDALKAKYGIPSGTAVKFGERGADSAPVKLAANVQAESAPVKLAEAAPAEAAAPAPQAKEGAPAAGGDPKLIAEGTELFNGTCAHCHGPYAVQAERKIDLRLLHHRYGDGMEQMFFTTVTNGRPSKGMPSWKDVFTQDQFVAILAFLKSVQTE
jgi:ABC-type amino acid transport substrate-binding protein/mono/diheme cytochrome c family protein